MATPPPAAGSPPGTPMESPPGSPPPGKLPFRTAASPDCVTSHLAAGATPPAPSSPLRLLRVIGASSSAASSDAASSDGETSSEGGSPPPSLRMKARSFRARRLSECSAPIPRELRKVRELERAVAAATNDHLPITRDLQLYQSVISRRDARSRMRSSLGPGRSSCR